MDNRSLSCTKWTNNRGVGHVDEHNRNNDVIGLLKGYRDKGIARAFRKSVFSWMIVKMAHVTTGHCISQSHPSPPSSITRKLTFDGCHGGGDISRVLIAGFNT